MKDIDRTADAYVVKHTRYDHDGKIETTFHISARSGLLDDLTWKDLMAIRDAIANVILDKEPTDLITE